MNTKQFRMATSPEFGQRKSIAVLALILSIVALSSILHSLAKPFWFDEICTVIMSKLPSASATWKALGNAADTNPPLYYLLTRFCRHLIPSDELAYRFPSVLGLLATVSCLYAILSRQVDRLSALVGAVFVLCTPLSAYSYEARPYSLVIACVSFAILVWLRVDDSKFNWLLLTIAMAAAISLHYYAIYVWPAFLLAELSVWICHRRFRIGVWSALLISLLPFFLSRQLLLKLRQYYGHAFWAHPGGKALILAIDWLFGFGEYWGLAFVATITALFVYFDFRPGAKEVSPDWRQRLAFLAPVENQIFMLTLLWLPLIIFAGAEVSHSGMTARYMLPAVLGGALALGYIAEKLPAGARVVLLALFLTHYALSSALIGVELLSGSLFHKRVASTEEFGAIIDQYDQLHLPVVISDGIRYLPMAYYTRGALGSRLYYVADPSAADRLTAMKSDSVDLALLVLRQYFPLHVVDYSEFVLAHPQFLVVSDGGDLEWWPARLADDHSTVTVLAAGSGIVVYKVTVAPRNTIRP